MMTDGSERSADLLAPIEREAHEWVLRFAAGGAHTADLAAFQQWSARDPAHAQAFARACRLWEALEPAGKMLPPQLRTERAAARPKLARRAFIGGALTASFVGGAALVMRPPFDLWPSWSELTADLRTGPGEQRSIVLKGGASIDLNTRTSIALRTTTDDLERIELIGGEAEISTPSDGPQRIEVIAGDGRVAASQASFNLRFENANLCATCVRGMLEIEHRGSSARLRPGEQISYSAQGLGPARSVDPQGVTAWKDGVLVFHGTPLSQAIAEINRYRAGRIILTNAALGRRLFNARFRIANVEDVVKQIQQIFGAKVVSLPGGIVLLG
jgi:transmembrane sensor